MRVAGPIAACLAVLAIAPVAQAAQRYAVPDGTGEACTQGAPCSLVEAIEKAGAGDGVIVTAGTYSVAALIDSSAAGLAIHGDAAAAAPRIIGSLGGQALINLRGVGSALGHVDLINTATEGVGARCFDGTRLERIRATGIGEGAAGAVAHPGCAVRDSLLQAQGTNSLGMESLGQAGSIGSTVRNVTAIASGENSAGIQSRYSDSAAGAHTLTLTNSITEGASDLRTEDSLEGTGRIVVSNSNFDSAKAETEGAIGGSANQTAPPLFVAPGDFRPAPGSPTIDAGAPGELGALDLAGNPRFLGSAPDIGAFEFVPPPPPPAVSIGSLAISPRRFRALRAGGAVVSRANARKAPRGATVRYSLSAAGTVSFRIERALKGRRVGRRCVKQTRGNSKRKRCSRYRAVKGSFTQLGVAGGNSFRFSGRLRNRRLTPHSGALAPGRYRLVAEAGGSRKQTGFTIVR